VHVGERLLTDGDVETAARGGGVAVALRREADGRGHEVVDGVERAALDGVAEGGLLGLDGDVPVVDHRGGGGAAEEAELVVGGALRSADEHLAGALEHLLVAGPGDDEARGLDLHVPVDAAVPFDERVRREVGALVSGRLLGGAGGEGQAGREHA